MKNEKELQEEKVLEKELNGAAHIAVIAPGVDSHHEPEANGAEILDEAEDDEKAVDYSVYSKKDFVELVSELAGETNFQKLDKIVREIRPLYDELRERERSVALDKYKESSGSAEGFEYKGDDYDQAFDAYLRLIRDRRHQHFRVLEEQKGENLKKRLDLIERLRAVVDAEDSEHSFQQFKLLQQEWKNAGPVAIGQVKTLWANYSALVDRFYDQRSIYFELKELDRKKNLAAKLELCEKAERLADIERVKEAISQLNELHHEFKHIGPVPKEEKELVWQRFKAASDAVYKRRDEYVSGLQNQLQKNLEEKLRLGELLMPFVSFQSDRIKEWNQKTQEILELQKKWEASGAVPRARAKEVNKKFWSAFKGFFSNKSAFFRKLDDEREKNLQVKTELIKKALELRDSNDWNRTANELKELQRQWKETGPVPEKFREKIFQEFKQACDHFFDQRRGQFEKAEHEQDQNLRAKEALCVELETLAAQRAGSLSQLTEIRNKFNAIGFVPRKSISAIRTRFTEAVNSLLAALPISEDEKERALLEVQLGNLKDDPEAERKLYHKEHAIRKRITKAENDIAVLRNNLEFFGRSKNAEKFKQEFNAKIEEANTHLSQLKNQLKLLRTVSQ